MEFLRSDKPFSSYGYFSISTDSYFVVHDYQSIFKYLTLYSVIDNLLKASTQHWDHFGTNKDLLSVSNVVHKRQFRIKYFGNISCD